jgi:ribosomal protein S18 acetylase RimI-like enzyme
MGDKLSTPIIRTMTIKDLPSITEIDAKVLGRKRPAYWEVKLTLIKKRSSISSLVAELDGKAVGFIIGDASGWEYGVPDTVGCIDTIGVHPDFQKKGIAKMLMTEMINNMKKLGVKNINTFVSWRDWELLKFFAASGFERGTFLNLELKI